MTTPDPVLPGLVRARRSYERSFVLSGMRGALLAALLCVIAAQLHDLTATAQLLGGALAITLGVLGWRGGAWKRGSIAGALAGFPALIAPWLVFAVTHRGHFGPCPACDGAPTLTCVVTCFTISAVVSAAVGYRASQDRSPHRYAAAALVAAVLTGTLACASTGIGGVLGIVVGLVTGGATGWAVAHRSA